MRAREGGLPADDAVVGADAREDAVHGRQPRRRRGDVAAQLRITCTLSKRTTHEGCAAQVLPAIGEGSHVTSPMVCDPPRLHKDTELCLL